MSDQEESLPPGARFGSYEIVRVLGAGAFGVVYEALRQPLGKRVALKVLHKKLVSQQEVLQRFMREAQTTARIRHPHIVETFDIGEFEGAPYLAMEFIEGEPLSRRLKRETRLPLTLAIDVTLPVVAAMATVHDHGIIHRDLKPENIFLERLRGGGVHPKVLDFGIAKVSSDPEFALTRTTALLGTPYYMSPEQAKESKHIDARSDQWSVGVMLYECLTGRRPFTGGSLLELLMKISEADYAPPSTLVPDVPLGVEAVVARMLSRDPAQRYPDMRAVGIALLPWSSDAVRPRWTDEFYARSSIAPPSPDEVADTTEIPENAVKDVLGGTPSDRSSSAPRGLAPPLVSSASLEPGTGTAAMIAPPLPVSGSTLNLAARESVAAAPPAPQKSNRNLVAAVAGAVAMLAVGGTWLATRQSVPPSQASAHAAAPTPLPRFRVTTRVEPATAAITLDGDGPVTGSIDREFPRDGRLHTLAVTAPGYRRAEFTFRDHFSSPEIVLVPEAPAAPPAAPATAEAPAQPDPAAAPRDEHAQRVARVPRRPGAAAPANAAAPARPRRERPAAQAAEPETGSNGVAIR